MGGRYGLEGVRTDIWSQLKGAKNGKCIYLKKVTTETLGCHDKDIYVRSRSHHYADTNNH